MELKTAITSGKMKTDLQDPQEDTRGRIREASKRDVQRVTKYDGWNIVERSTPSETEKETADRAGAGNVEASTSAARERERERNGEREKTLDLPGLTVMLSGCRSGQAQLRWER
jgi:hypothetical protein